MTSQPPATPFYFFDECVSSKLVDMLRAISQPVTHLFLEDGFSRGMKDIEWMPLVAKRGWIVVTDDNRISSRKIERKLLDDLQLRFVFIAGGFAKLGFFEQAKFLINAWEGVLTATARCKAGDCFRVTMNKKVESL